LIQHGYDEQMGARPMARVIQEHIKKPLADEVLFGKLKNGGHVRVVVVREGAGADGAADQAAEAKTGEKTGGDEKLGFEFLEGRVVPKPEHVPEPPKDKRRGGGGGGVKSQRANKPGPRDDGGAPPNKGSVPKIPLVKV
jgi:ATP-dependent Clp protease ATP-binding subunit ClpA